jgi:site-specific DNA-cytosine methylase
MVTFVDNQGFAGGFTLGGVQAGMKLVAKYEEEGGFGAANCDNNRHLLGMDWKLQMSKPAEWEPVHADVVLANPPCSGFSSMSWGVNRKSYGIKAKVNQCMWNLMDFAGRMPTPPQVLVMESVQAAAVTGIPLMRDLRARLEELTGERYWMYHVLQNNAALGGCSLRRRYFLVLSRIPFGIETPNYGPAATLRDAIGDLEPLDYRTMGRQEYKAAPSDWLVKNNMVNPDGWVDGHCVAPENNQVVKRILDLLDGDTEDVQIWPENRCMVWALRTYWQTHGHLPDSWHFRRQKSGQWADEALIANDFEMGFTRPKRWVYDVPARVIIGGAMWLVVHPEQRRLLTHRECARILGFPDTWMAEPMKANKGLAETWGKGVSVHAGRWIARWAKDAVEGRPGSITGVPVTEHYRLAKHGPHERESVIDVGHVAKAVYPVTIERGGVVVRNMMEDEVLMEMDNVA